MSTRSTRKWNQGKHAQPSKRTQQITHQKKRLAGASLALMLSVSSAALTQGATLAFAAETDPEPTTEAAPEETPEVTPEDLPLAGSSLMACAKALVTDLGTGSSLVEAASFDPVAAREAERAVPFGHAVPLRRHHACRVRLLRLHRLCVPQRSWHGTAPFGCCAVGRG